jgi:L-ascorbate 6-phosphate lactonase
MTRPLNWLTAPDPFEKSHAPPLVVEQRLPPAEFMGSIRGYEVPANGLAIWFLGQNGFILKDPSGLLLGIDLYLSNSCARLYSHLPFRLDRQLPIFIEPEDLDVDFFVTTHSHDDHADPETIERHRAASRKTKYIGPWQSIQKYRTLGVEEEDCILIHAAETLALGNGTFLAGTFALPTDPTDLNHIGLLFEASNGITLYNTGDSAYSELLGSLLPQHVDICAICINGGFHNLSHMQAAEVVKAIRPKVVIPSHYDMMVNTWSPPSMFQVALSVLNVFCEYRMLRYYEPYVYVRT